MGASVQIECQSDEISSDYRTVGLDGHPTNKNLLQAVWKITAEKKDSCYGHSCDGWTHQRLTRRSRSLKTRKSGTLVSRSFVFLASDTRSPQMASERESRCTALSS